MSIMQLSEGSTMLTEQPEKRVEWIEYVFALGLVEGGCPVKMIAAKVLCFPTRPKTSGGEEMREHGGVGEMDWHCDGSGNTEGERTVSVGTVD